uniref:Hexosyltransferase n=1 Tax=Ditylenchus dipsaci TaxID=166011 RepID=A0A915E4H8_9BILA
MYKSISHLKAFFLLLMCVSCASECRPIYFNGKFLCVQECFLICLRLHSNDFVCNSEGIRNSYAKLYNVKFVMKLDDDVIIDLHRLQYWIDRKMEPLRREHQRTEFRIRQFRMLPHRNIKSPWFVSTENFSDSPFPPYTSGAMWLVLQ